MGAADSIIDDGNGDRKRHAFPHPHLRGPGTHQFRYAQRCMGAQLPGRGISSADVEPKTILPPMAPPMPPPTCGKSLKLHAVGTTTRRRTTRSVITVVPS